ncbi:hypothetical protein EV421DRAFT_1937232 [Armillaria borealis]|uniref:Uncharacterized protein n=1 Tax=Armillaria borealis TaxID=47425 RepID=A0AA39JNF3_9AGAR|nr:hypothetical protein EV421DRAFT_1937232 [Armillaria borealis]
MSVVLCDLQTLIFAAGVTGIEVKDAWTQEADWMLAAGRTGIEDGVAGMGFTGELSEDAEGTAELRVLDTNVSWIYFMYHGKRELSTTQDAMFEASKKSGRIATSAAGKC